MDKKIVVLNGSPRKKGNCAALIAQITRGAEQHGSSVETIYLHSLDIEPCNGCFQCVEKEKGCPIQDDMQSLYPKFLEADAIVFASPIYWFNLSAQLKLCIDRLVAFDIKGGGNRLAGKKVALVFSYGASSLQESGGINAVNAMEMMFNYIQAELVGMVYGSADQPGEISRNQPVMTQAYELGVKLAGGGTLSKN